MKKPFEAVVEENAGWLYRYVRSKTADRETAEDLTQEVWLRAFRAWDSYEERGMLRHWLMRIAVNTVRSAFSAGPEIVVFSLDAAEGEDDPLLNLLPDGDAADPLEEMERRERVADILAAIDRLPEKHRQVMTFRFLMDLPVGEVAKRMQIPEGSVKSSTHYAIGKIRKELGIPNKGEKTMTCENAKNYLFMYAKGKLTPDRRKEVAEHLASCPRCREMEESLEALVPHIPAADGCGIYHFSISFPDDRLMYTCIGRPIPNAEELNGRLKELDGRIPDDESWFESGFNGSTVSASFLNEGEECEFKTWLLNPESHYYRMKLTKIPRVYPFTFRYDTLTNVNETYGDKGNGFGGAVYSAIYQAVPKNHGPLKMKSGDGFIDCGAYTFAYAARYLDDNEDIFIRYTFE